MRLGDAPDSDNFEDRTGQSGGGGMSMGGMGGGVVALLAQLVVSKFGLVGLLVLALGYCAFSGMLGGGGSLAGGSGGPSDPGQSTLTQDQRKVLVGVLESTDAVWGQMFRQAGHQYPEPKLVAYSDSTRTACGAGQAMMGPFYCPGDKTIYIDPAFFSELAKRFQAPGDFAQGYVIAHEVGHHIQNMEGTLDRVQAAQARSDKAGGNQLQVGVELQADCYAGVWAANARATDGQPLLEPGDMEEGMRAAEAIGDDTLQRQMQGRVVPESFTHGSSAQRMEALQRGLKSGNPASCNYAR